MVVALRIVLVFGLLVAHTPVCKAVTLSPRTQDAARQPTAPPCCGKCAKKNAERPHDPPPKSPAKPACPNGTDCALCATPVAVVPDAAAVADHDAPPSDRVVEARRVRTADGFQSRLDRPPRR